MEKDSEVKGGGVSKVKLALGAASLFFFIVGVKRTFRTEEGREIREGDEEIEGTEAKSARDGRHNRVSRRR